MCNKVVCFSFLEINYHFGHVTLSAEKTKPKKHEFLEINFSLLHNNVFNASD